MLQAIGEHRRFSYEYDFGDAWEHEVVVEEATRIPRGLKFAVCLDGQNACPPEDCGGVSGYAEPFEVLADPDQEEQEHFTAGSAVASTRRCSTSPPPTPPSSSCADRQRAIAAQLSMDGTRFEENGLVALGVRRRQPVGTGGLKYTQRGWSRSPLGWT